MLNKLKTIAKGNFFRNVAVLASGTIVSQIIIMATLPLITRLYDPSEYGVYSMYTSVISIMLMLVSFSYENAITLPEEDRTASSLINLSLRICIGVSIVGGVGLFLLGDVLTAWTKKADIQQYYIYFIVTLLVGGFYQILNAWSVRKKYFRQLSRTKYTQSLSLVTSQIVLSRILPGPLGLIVGDTLGRFSGLIQQWRLWRKDVNDQSMHTDWTEIRNSAARYRRFPQLSLPSNILNSMGIYLPTILLAAFYGPGVAGLFALGQRILGSPMTLIITSVKNVYLSESSRNIVHAPYKLYPLFIKTARNVFFVGLFIVAVMVLIAPTAFSFLFGEQWGESGHYVRLLGMMYLSQFVANAVGSTIDIMERQDLNLLREVIRVTIVLGALLLAKYTGQDASIAVLYYSIAATLGYVLHLGLSWVAIRKYRSVVAPVNNLNSEGSC